MGMVLWGITSFRLQRMPPIAREYVLDGVALGRSMRADSLAMRSALRSELGVPLHVLASGPGGHGSTAVTKMHVFQGDLPYGSIVDVSSDFDDVRTASPLLALLAMAPTMSETHLIMALCELCGTFSVFDPSRELRAWLQGLIDAHALPALDGWRPVLTRDGRLTSLWRRPAVASVEEARTFADSMRGRYGCKRFSRAAEKALDGAASPLEVQAALLLGLSRRMGGSGFPAIRLNARIPMSPGARLIASKETCFADLLIEGKEGTRPVVVECQSELIHNADEQALADGERLMALQSMGYTVVPLTHEQLAIPPVYAMVERYLARELGLRVKSKSPGLKRKELDLRRDLFIDWTTLGE